MMNRQRSNSKSKSPRRSPSIFTDSGFNSSESDEENEELEASKPESKTGDYNLSRLAEVGPPSTELKPKSKFFGAWDSDSEDGHDSQELEEENEESSTVSENELNELEFALRSEKEKLTRALRKKHIEEIEWASHKSSIDTHRKVGVHETTRSNYPSLIADGPIPEKIDSGSGIGKGRGFYITVVGAVINVSNFIDALYGRCFAVVYIPENMKRIHAENIDLAREIAEEEGFDLWCLETGKKAGAEIVVPEEFFGHIKVVEGTPSKQSQDQESGFNEKPAQNLSLDNAEIPADGHYAASELSDDQIIAMINQALVALRQWAVELAIENEHDSQRILASVRNNDLRFIIKNGNVLLHLRGG